MTENYDYIILGGGIIGTSTAYHLKRIDNDKKVILIEKNDRVGKGNTAKSAALYRDIFSSVTSRILVESSIKYYESIADQISLNPTGYLWLFSQNQWKNSQSAIIELSRNNCEISLLDQNQIKEKLEIIFEGKKSSIEAHDIYSAIYSDRCGSLSAMKLTQHYLKKFQDIGGKVKYQTEISSINLTYKDENYPPWRNIKASGLTDTNGNKYISQNIIITAGAWTHKLLSDIGIYSGVLPKKRQLFGLNIENKSQMSKNPQKMPVVILPTAGIYIKPILNRNMIILGCADELGRSFKIDEIKEIPKPEISYFKTVIEPILNYYFPKLKNYNLKLKWAGYYSYYWPDKNPVIEQVSNILWTSGTSGSGIMKADAIGRITASKIIGLKTATLFDKTKFPTEALSLKNRDVDQEKFVL